MYNMTKKPICFDKSLNAQKPILSIKLKKFIKKETANNFCSKLAPHVSKSAPSDGIRILCTNFGQGGLIFLKREIAQISVLPPRFSLAQERPFRFYLRGQLLSTSDS